MPDANEPRALVIACMDWRLHPALDDLIRERLGGPFDSVCVAGAAKSFVGDAPSAVRDFLLGHVDIARDLHGVRKVVLVNHTDCGAYGGRAAFVDESDERGRHARDLAEAQRVLRTRDPEMEVDVLLAELHPRGEAWRVTLRTP